MNAKWITYFFIIGVVFEAEICFSNDNRLRGDSYSQNQLLYQNKEEANRMQLKQIELENKIRTMVINYNYRKQQFKTNSAREREKTLKTNKYQNNSWIEKDIEPKNDENIKQIEEKVNFDDTIYVWDEKNLVKKIKTKID